MEKIRLTELVLDFNVYPRTKVSSYNVASIAEAISAGVELPPIIADQTTKRVSDGFHRHGAYSRVLGPDAEVDVVLKPYADDAELFADSMRYNATHGARLTKFDKLRCVLRSEELGLSVDSAIKALGMTVQAFDTLRINRVGRLTPPSTGEEPPKESGSIPLKRTIEHMTGREMTPGQVMANGRLSGMDQRFYINQLLLLISENLVDLGDRKVMRGLNDLHTALSQFFREHEDAAA